jgi:hypothetical protein
MSEQDKKNPFLNPTAAKKWFSTGDGVRVSLNNQISKMAVGESKMIDNNGNPDGFRKGVSSHGKVNNKAFRTIKDKDENTWVKRIK